MRFFTVRASRGPQIWALQLWALSGLMLCGLALSRPAVVHAEAAVVEAPGSIPEAEADRRTHALADELHSPFCPGKSLLACTSGQAYELRKEMKRMFLRGLDREQVVAELKLRYGDQVSNPPQPWYISLVPFLPFIVGGVILAFLLNTWLRRSRAATPEVTEIAVEGEDAERLARLRAQIASDDD